MRGDNRNLQLTRGTARRWCSGPRFPYPNLLIGHDYEAAGPCTHIFAVKELDDAGWDAGAEQIRFWLAEPGRWPDELGAVLPSRSTINRVLGRRGQIVEVPQRRPRRSRHRFEYDQPNSLWQMDGFGYTLADGHDAVVLQLTAIGSAVTVPNGCTSLKSTTSPSSRRCASADAVMPG